MNDTNDSKNNSGSGWKTERTFGMIDQETLFMVQRFGFEVYLPFLIFLGLFGNVASLLTILGTTLKKIPPNLYLALLCASDSCYLVGLFPVWLHTTGALKPQRIHCQLTNYLLNFSSFVSSWCLMLMSVERFLVISNNFGHPSVKRCKRVFSVIVIVPAVFSLYSFVIYDLRQGRCQVAPDRYQLAEVLTVIDNVLLFVVPLLTVVLSNCAVLVCMCGGGGGRRTRTRQPGCVSEMVRQRRRRQQLSTILVVVPLTFLLLNAPNYSLRLYLFFYPSVWRRFQLDTNLQLAAFLALFMNHSNFGINLPLYCSTSGSFRKMAPKILRAQPRQFTVSLRSRTSIERQYLRRPNAHLTTSILVDMGV